MNWPVIPWWDKRLHACNENRYHCYNARPTITKIITENFRLAGDPLPEGVYAYWRWGDYPIPYEHWKSLSEE